MLTNTYITYVVSFSPNELTVFHLKYAHVLSYNPFVHILQAYFTCYRTITHECPSATEVTLKDMGKTDMNQTLTEWKQCAYNSSDVLYFQEEQ